MIKLKVNGKGRPFDGAPEMPLLFVMLSQTPPIEVHWINSTNRRQDWPDPCRRPFCLRLRTATGERIRTMPMTKQGFSFA